MRRSRRKAIVLVTAVATVAALATALPLLANDRAEITLTPVADNTSTAVPQDGDNSVKTTLATCPMLCQNNPNGWRDATLRFDVRNLPAGATKIQAKLRLWSWQTFTASVSVYPGGDTTGTGLVNARPMLGAQLDGVQHVVHGYNDLNVAAVVGGDGSYTFTLRQAGLSTPIYWASKENTNAKIRPVLDLTYENGKGKPAPTVSPAPTVTSIAPPATATAAPTRTSALPTVTATKPSSAPPATLPPTQDNPAGWKLTWDDEFNGNGLDTSKWQAKNNTSVDYDLACITSNPDNIFVQNGVATLQAQRQNATCGSQNRAYTTSYLTTQGKASFTYGRFEIRAKTPTGPGNSTGLWPAFWLRPDDGGNGEIDVMELPGGQQYYKAATQAIFYNYTPVKQDNRYTFAGTGYPADGFHTYTTEWDPGVMRWYIDGKQVYERDRSTTPWFDSAFSRPFHLLMNFQVGGWLGNPNASTQLPADFQVDYVRVYQQP